MSSHITLKEINKGLGFPVRAQVNVSDDMLLKHFVD